MKNKCKHKRFVAFSVIDTGESFFFCLDCRASKKVERIKYPYIVFEPMIERERKEGMANAED